MFMVDLPAVVMVNLFPNGSGGHYDWGVGDGPNWFNACRA